MTRVMTVVGTRPEIIRLSRVIARLDETFDHVLVHTGQNYDYTLNEIFFQELAIRSPDRHLGVDTTSLGSVLGGVIVGVERAISEFQPDALLVLGDTNSCLSAVIAKRMRVPVYHMEAGNRCFDENVPEETNRRMVDHVADFNLVYTEHARRNLLAEGLHPRRIVLTGSPMREVLEYHRQGIEASPVLARLSLDPQGYFLVSAHREENVDNPARLEELLHSLSILHATHGLRIIVSTHPRTRLRLDQLGADEIAGVEFHEPLGLLDYCRLQLESACVLSDSGTISEESLILGFPAVTLRESIERPESLDTGGIVMCGLARDRVLASVDMVLGQFRSGARPDVPAEYMIGNTSQRTVNFIQSTAGASASWAGLRQGPELEYIGSDVRIRLLTQYFDPEPTLKGLDFARRLAAHGHEVRVLTGFPNYPGGKIYPGFSREFASQEVRDGVLIERRWLHPSHSSSVGQRLANYGSFAATATMRIATDSWKPEVTWVHHPPLTTALAAFAPSRFQHGSSVVLEIQDLWPDSLASTGMVEGGGVLKCIGACARMAYRRADRIVVISDGFKRALVDRGVPSEKIEVIYNWADSRGLAGSCEPAPRLASKWGAEGKFVVMFAGNMGPAQSLVNVLRAAEIVLHKTPDIQFVLVGDGIARTDLEEDAKRRRLTNVSFVGRQPIEAMGGMLPLADALLVHLRDDPLFEITIPSKTQAYLAAGRPIVMAVKGDAARLVTRAGAGVTCTPDVPAELAQAVLGLKAMPAEQRATMGERGQSFYRDELAIDHGVQRYLALFTEMRAPRRR